MRAFGSDTSPRGDFVVIFELIFVATRSGTGFRFPLSERIATEINDRAASLDYTIGELYHLQLINIPVFNTSMIESSLLPFFESFIVY